MAELDARVIELRAEEGRLTQEILTLERGGVRVPDNAEWAEPKAAAMKLLCGEQPEPLALWSEPQRRLTECHNRRSVISTALALADDVSRSIAARESGERIKAHEAEWRAAVKAICLTLIQLEHDQQKLDQLRREIRPVVPMQFDGWTFAGRLKDRVGVAYRYLRIAVGENILTEAEFGIEQQRADDARTGKIK